MTEPYDTERAETEMRPEVFAPVRARCGATGRYVGERDGRHLVLFVSASDNSLGVDDLKPDEEPWAKSPLPTKDECSAFLLGLWTRPPARQTNGEEKR